MGTLLVMYPWRSSMSTMATTGGVPSGVARNAMGTPSSMAVPACPARTASMRRAEIARVVAVHAPPQPREAREGAVRGHHADDGREVVVQLGEPGPEPEGQLYRHGAGDPVAGEGEADDGDPVVLAAGGEEEGLVEDAEEGDEDGGRGRKCWKPGVAVRSARRLATTRAT
jgi:hypothetical protein